MNPIDLDNPLLTPLSDASLPRYDAIRPEHVTPAIAALLTDADAALERVLTDAVPTEYDAIAEVCRRAQTRSTAHPTAHRDYGGSTVRTDWTLS